MKTFIEAYRERIESNDIKLRLLGRELQKLGYKVLISKSKELINSLTIRDNNKGVRVQFNEVPYRFSFEYDIKPSREKGSGYTGEEFFVSGLDLPFTINDIVKAFRPMYIDNRFEDLYKEL